MLARATAAPSSTSPCRRNIFTARDERRRSSESRKPRLSYQTPSAWRAGAIVSVVVRGRIATHRELEQLLPGLYLTVKRNPNNRSEVTHRTTHTGLPAFANLGQSRLGQRANDNSHSAFTVSMFGFFSWFTVSQKSRGVPSHQGTSSYWSQSPAAAAWPRHRSKSNPSQSDRSQALLGNPQAASQSSVPVLPSQCVYARQLVFFIHDARITRSTWNTSKEM